MAADKEKQIPTYAFQLRFGTIVFVRKLTAKALERFNLVVKSNPEYLFKFNAQLNALQIETKHPDKAIKELTKMAKTIIMPII